MVFDFLTTTENTDTKRKELLSLGSYGICISFPFFGRREDIPYIVILIGPAKDKYNALKNVDWSLYSH